MQNSNVTKVTNSRNNSSSNFNSVTSLPKEAIPEVSPASSKSPKEMEIDAFLDEVHKKKVSDGIRQRNREKKLQTQESLPTHPEEKMPQELNSVIQPCNNSTYEVSENVDLGSLKCFTSDPEIHNQKIVTGGSRSRKKEWMNSSMNYSIPLWNQISSINHNNVTEVSETARPGKVTYDSIDEASQHLAQLCDKAIDAEDRANRANQEEILCWCLYWKEFRDQLDEIIRSNGGKFGEKKARSMLYDTITEQLSILRKKRSQELGLKLRDVSQDSLRKKTQS